MSGAGIHAATGKTIAVGFDGFVDTLVRPVAKTSADGTQVFYPTIPAFGQYLAGQGGKSCSIGLKVHQQRIGGNAPLLATAAHALGLAVSLVGMLGQGSVDEIFRSLPFPLYTYAAPGVSTALEFDDGKVFFAPEYTLEEPAFETFANRAGKQALQEANLLALVNWSELSYAHALWQGTLETCVAPHPANRANYAFFDLADSTRKPANEIEDVLKLIGQFSAKRTTILSLNENEALVAGQAALGGANQLEGIAAGLRQTYGIDEILIHTLHCSILCTGRGLANLPVQTLQKPRISTGAGDNFNAASCYAALAGWGDEERLRFANRYVHQYLLQGSSPALKEIEL